jgi:hypothetical protein
MRGYERLFDVNGTMRFPTMTVEEILRADSNHRADQNSPVILVVDDERVIADTLSVILSRNGFAAMTAYNGTSALEIATLVPPQLLISDVMMPGMSGIDLASRSGMPCRIAKSYYFPHGHLQQTSSRQPALQDLTLWRSQNPYTQPRCSHEYRSASNCEKKFWLRRQYRVQIGPKGKKPLEAIGSGIHLSRKCSRRWATDTIRAVSPAKSGSMQIGRLGRPPMLEMQAQGDVARVLTKSLESGSPRATSGTGGCRINMARRNGLRSLACIICIMQVPSHVQEHIETIARHEQEFYAKRSRADKIGDAVAGFAGNSLSFLSMLLSLLFGCS